MMSRIQILPQIIANKISAGEVVERPASVVKELVENSIDAQSTRITIEFEENGQKLIRVTDDGYGMTKEESALALERHATSKISKIEDLSAIKTLGFRGEALPSIACVSLLQLTTRTKDDIAGSFIRAEGGEVKEFRETGAPLGTSVEVRELFFNTPARRKFLKTPLTEVGHINDVITRLALGRLNIHFKLIHNGNLVIDAVQTDMLLERIRNFFGEDLTGDLVPLDFDSEPVKLRGFIGNLSQTRTNRGGQFIFVNNRSVKNSTIAHGILQGYHALLPANRFPVAFAFLGLDHSLVDVNVHPTKSEVRFLNQNVIHDMVAKAVRTALRRAELTPKIQEEVPLTSFSQEEKGEEKKDKREERIKEALGEYFKRQGEEKEKALFTTPHPFIRPSEPQPSLTSDVRFLGQLRNTYILAEDKQGLLIIDQHAAHERIIYEKLMRAFGKTNIDSQGLLIPVTFELSHKETALFRQILPSLHQIGLEIDNFGLRTFIIRAIPILLDKIDLKEFIHDLIDEFEAQERAQKNEEIREKVVIMMACRAAVKAGDYLKTEELQSLLVQLQKTELPHTCPHGRPTIIRLDEDELAKRFKRT